MSTKRTITLGFSILLIAIVALWMMRHSIANALIDDALLKATQMAKRYKVELVDMESGPLLIPTPFDISTQKFKTKFDIGINNRDKIRSQFDASSVEIMVVQVMPPKARLSLKEFGLKLHPDDIPKDFPFDQFRSGSFTSQALPIHNLKASFKEAYQQLTTLFTENVVNADFSFSGYVSVPVKKGKHVDVLLYTEMVEGEGRRLRFKREDLDKLVEASDVRVSSDMLDILSQYPLRTPFIMLITHEAKAESSKLKKKFPSYPEDAHRHILWSYMLTKEFGPEFAKMVTDSHETLDGNTADERKMDYHNNAVARNLATEGVELSKIRQLIMKDPRIIRHPSEVSSFPALLK